MFNVGGGELLVILLIALIVLGPSRLPDAARQIGKAMGDLRRLSTSFQNEVRSAIDTADDPDKVGTRREVLTGSEPEAPASADEHPARKEPLVAAPVPEPPPAKLAAKRTPAKATKAKAATKSTGKSGAAKPAAKSTSAKKAAPKNGTAVEKPSTSTSPDRRTETS